MDFCKEETFRNSCLKDGVQKRLLLMVVSVALLLDSLLSLVVIPLLPDYLEEFRLQNSIFSSFTSQVNDTSWSNISITDARMLLLFSSKPIVQVLVGPITGTITDRIGYKSPLVFGLFIIFLSTLLFAFGRSYFVLFVARSLQGIGSALSDMAGFAAIADRYKDETERTAAQGIALAFINIGVYVAPPLGGFFHKYADVTFPFLVLALLALIACLSMIFVMSPKNDEVTETLKKENKATPMYRLVADPYILILAGALIITNIPWGFLETTLPLWMKETMNVSEFQAGLVWCVPLLFYLIGIFFTVFLARFYPANQWITATVGLAVEGLMCVPIYFCPNFVFVILPLGLCCLGAAAAETSIFPMMAHIIDYRYVSVYGSIYAIASMSISFVLAAGFLVADLMYQKIGFFWMVLSICIVNLMYAPLLIFVGRIYKLKPNYTNLITEENLTK